MSFRISRPCLDLESSRLRGLRIPTISQAECPGIKDRKSERHREGSEIKTHRLT